MKDLRELAMNLPAKGRSKKLDPYRELIMILQYEKHYTCVEIAEFLGNPKKMAKVGAKAVKVDQSSVWDLLDEDPGRERRLKEARARRRRNTYQRPSHQRPRPKHRAPAVPPRPEPLEESLPEPPVAGEPNASQPPIFFPPKTLKPGAFHPASLLTNDQVPD